MEIHQAKMTNVIVILSDDQGYWSLGCTGNKEIQTPNLDALAASGTLLTRFYTASPVCSPARASLLTGRMPSAHGVHDFLRPSAPGSYQVYDYLEGLTTTPEALAAAGWRCGITGKWHLGNGGDLAHGFEHTYIHAGGQGPYYAAPMWREGSLVVEDRYITDLITDDAISFLDQSLLDQRPFYLSVHYTAPHAPWVGEHPEEFVSLYSDCQFLSCPQEPLHPWWSAPSPAISEAVRNPRPSLQGYFAAVTAMDRQIGRLIHHLDTTGLRSSTLIVFLSDNGFSCGQHGIWGKGNSTWPLNVFEESIRVPAIVSQPGNIPSGAVCEAMISGCDLHPTLLDLTGVRVQDDPLAAGRSFLPSLLAGPGALDHRDHLVVYDEYGDTRMIRTAEWKYVDRGRDGPAELYAIEEDPNERFDLSEDITRKAIRNELHGLLLDWFEAHTDPDRDSIGAGVAGAGQASPYRRSSLDQHAFYPRVGLNPSY